MWQCLEWIYNHLSESVRLVIGIVIVLLAIIFSVGVVAWVVGEIVRFFGG